MPYLLLWALMVYGVQRGAPDWLTLLLALPAGGLLVRLFIIFHDCCHGSFLGSRRANTIVGYVTGVLTFSPYEEWRRTHNRHHATAGDLDRRGSGDIWTLTTQEYASAARRRRWAYRIYRHPLVFIGLGSLVYFLVLQRFAGRGAGSRERLSVWRTNLALLGMVMLASATIGFETYLRIQLPVIAVAGSLGLWLFHVQHQFAEVYWSRHEAWDPLRVALAGSSYFKLPRLLQWFTGNIGLHHVHHVRPSIPNYHLQRCHNAVDTLRAVPALTLWTSVRSLHLSLYDEASRRLISFRAAAVAARMRKVRKLPVR